MARSCVHSPTTSATAIDDHGIRNSHLFAIAPTGSISLLAGNVSSGIEPIFAPTYRRAVLDETGVGARVRAYRLFRKSLAQARA